MAGKTKSEVIELLYEDVRFVIREIPDKKEVNLISEKWDARKDLADNSKKDVIQILFEDVRSVIKDNDTRLMVFDMFSFYEAIPDDSLTEQTQKTESEMSKPELVEELVRQTLRFSFYYRKPKYPMTPEERKASDVESRKTRIKSYEEALKENDKLTPKQKEFVRANYDKLFKVEDKSYDGAEKTFTEQSQWVEESFRKSYTNFSPEELRSLIASFTGIKGQRYLENFNRLKGMELFFPLEKLYSKAQLAEHKKFTESELGKKFSIAYFDDILTNTESPDEAENSKNPDGDESLDYLQNINKVINKFVAENYKK